MNFLNSILLMLGLKREPSITAITKPMAKIVAKLDDYAEKQALASAADKNNAARLDAQAKEKDAAALEARALSARYSSLTA